MNIVKDPNNEPFTPTCAPQTFAGPQTQHLTINQRSLSLPRTCYIVRVQIETDHLFYIFTVVCYNLLIKCADGCLELPAPPPRS